MFTYNIIINIQNHQSIKKNPNLIDKAIQYTILYGSLNVYIIVVIKHPCVNLIYVHEACIMMIHVVHTHVLMPTHWHNCMYHMSQGVVLQKKLSNLDYSLAKVHFLGPVVAKTVLNIFQVYQYFTIYRRYFISKFLCISYTTLFKIRRYQRPSYVGKSTWYCHPLVWFTSTRS